MSKLGILLLAGALLSGVLLAGAVPATAQTASQLEVSLPGSRPLAVLEPRPPTRIIVTPTRRAPLDRRAYRQCQDWYETEYRPSGTVLVPKMRCWWVRG